MDIEKKIIGRWADIKNNSSNFYKLIDYFDFKQTRYLTIIRNLEFSVEQGVVEYKRSSLLPVFRLLEGLKYRAVTIEELKIQKENLDELLFVILVQRLFTSGSLKITDTGNAEGISVDSIEIGTILKDILSRIKENPDIRNHPAVKNILVQFTIYKNEKKTMEKLAENIKKPSSSFYENFKITFTKIFKSIRKNYEVILKEDAARIKRKNILLLIPIKQAGSILFRQAKDITKIATSFGFAETEKYKIREILNPVMRAKDATLARIDAELHLYEELGAGLQEATPRQNAEQISLRFNREIISILQKYMEKEFHLKETEQ